MASHCPLTFDDMPALIAGDSDSEPDEEEEESDYFSEEEGSGDTQSFPVESTPYWNATKIEDAIRPAEYENKIRM